MKSFRHVVTSMLILASIGGCKPESPSADPKAAPDSTLLAGRAARLQARLAHPDSGKADAPLAQWSVAGKLDEISGLALTADGRLLTHEDSRGKVFEVDYRRGVIRKEFTLGTPPVHGDFESITLIGDTVVLFTSDGVLYRFGEAANDASVKYISQDTGLGAKCEFEGIAYEAATRTLLMACKKVHDKAFKDSLIIYRWPVESPKDTGTVKGKARKLSYLAVPLARIIGSNDWPTLHPSDIAIDPFTGNYLIIASIEKALFEITPAGVVVLARSLPPGHAQAEGVALTKDSILIISDEAKGGPALITLYRWPI